MGALVAIDHPTTVSLDSLKLDHLPEKVQTWIRLVKTDPAVIAGLRNFGNLRDYQLEAVLAAAFRIRKTVEPILITLPTGSGKSWVIAALASVVKEMSDARSTKVKKVMVLAHSKELVAQNHQKMGAAGYKATIYSAGLSTRDASGDVVFGSRQSIINAVGEFAQLDYEFSAVFVDEAHSMPTQTREIIEALRSVNPNLRVIGLTATPYALGKGYIFAQDTFRDLEPMRDIYAKEPYFAERVYDKCIEELFADEQLCPPILGTISDHYNTEALERTVGGSFSEASNNAVFVTGQADLTKRIVADVVMQSKNRAGVMFFAQNREHARQILSFLPEGKAALVDSGTKSKDRAQFIDSFKSTEIKYLVTVSALAIGFDAPNVSVIAVLKHTESPAFFQQIIGRGLRLCPEIGKRDCLVLDYGQNVSADANLFSPAIQVRMPKPGLDGPMIPVVEVICPDCDHVNTFRKAAWPQDMEMTDTGFLYHRDTRAIFTDSDNKPMAGHMGSQCGNLLDVPGKKMPVRCDYTWGAILCTACKRRNSHRTDFCVACEEPLSKRAKMLSMTTSRDANYTQRLAKVVSRQRQWLHPGKAKTSGAPNLRINLTVQELPYLVPEGTGAEQDEDDEQEAWVPPGMMLVRPAPKAIPVWLNPTATNADAQASWASFREYAEANRLTTASWAQHPEMDDLLPALAEPEGVLRFRAPSYLVYVENAVGGSERVFYNLKTMHKDHPEAEKINAQAPRDDTGELPDKGPEKSAEPAVVEDVAAAKAAETPESVLYELLNKWLEDASKGKKPTPTIEPADSEGEIYPLKECLLDKDGDDHRIVFKYGTAKAANECSVSSAEDGPGCIRVVGSNMVRFFSNGESGVIRRTR